jgi:hypothetical protein
MEKNEVLPPGQHPQDPWKKEIDPVAFGLSRLLAYLMWVEEHRASFEHYRNSDSESAERELDYLKHSTMQALQHLQRLAELLLAGFVIDPNKRLPRGLIHEVERLRSSLNQPQADG